MSTLGEIEAAVGALPLRDQQALLDRLAAKLSGNIPPVPRNLHELMKGGCGIVDSGLPGLASNPEHLRRMGRFN